jgi:hypothetical protein
MAMSITAVRAHLGGGGGGGGALPLRGPHQQLRGLLGCTGAVLQLRLRLLHPRHLLPQALHLQAPGRVGSKGSATSL